MPAIIAAIVTFFVKWVAVRVAFWIVVKGALLFFGTMILPVIIYNFVTGLIEEYLTWVLAAMGNVGVDGLQGAAFVLTGIGAWMAVHLKLAEALSIILSAIKIRLVMNMIPGVK